MYAENNIIVDLFQHFAVIWIINFYDVRTYASKYYVLVSYIREKGGNNNS